MFEQQLREFVEAALGVEVSFEAPPDASFGDIAIPCFSYAKQLRKSPAQIAQDFAAKLVQLPEFIERVAAVGPYVNVFLSKERVAGEVVPRILSEGSKHGSRRTGSGKTVVIEYASPNTNKPLHLGHVRNICLGDALARLYINHGFRVVRANIVNDRGIHICKAMLAYALYGEGLTPEAAGRKSDHFVGDFYVRFAREVGANPQLAEQAQALLNKWEQDDADTHALWEKLRAWCESGFNQTYADLGVGFDRIDYESKIWKSGKEIVLKGLADGVFIKDESGAVIAPLSESGTLPDKVLLRSDGTALYMTQDLYLAVTRHEELGFDELLYVVGSEQNQHFMVLFKILEMLGYAWAKRCHHYSYGMVYLPEGKMKSREGIVVDADDIVLQMRDLAHGEIAKRQADLGEEELHERAHMVGIAALKFMMLKVDASKDITFDPAEGISFEGDTGPYLQYTHARTASILAKLEGDGAQATFGSLDEVEGRLVMVLSRFEVAVDDAFVHQKPHLVVQYLLSLASTFNEFYHVNPVIKEADVLVRANRVALVRATKQVLANGLDLLGIRAIERM